MPFTLDFGPKQDWRDRLLPNRKIAKGNMQSSMRKGHPTASAPEETVATVSVEDSAPPRPLDGMMAEERRTQILQIVRSEGRARVNELASRFSSSAVTIRNDLNELHQRGLVLRSHGGAVLPEKILRESPVYERLKTHAEEKRRIGAAAATLIHDGETIILDSGTTTLEIARQLDSDDESAMSQGETEGRVVDAVQCPDDNRINFFHMLRQQE